jgi:hypothetical protein
MMLAPARGRHAAGICTLLDSRPIAATTTT